MLGHLVFTAILTLLLQWSGWLTGIPGVSLAAALSTASPTLLDWAKTLDPNGSPARIIELMSQRNEILDDMTWIEANGITSHRCTVRTGLPTPTWRLMNQGVVPTKGTTAQIDEAMGMLDSWLSVDAKLAKLGGNPDAFLMTQRPAHMEALAQELAATVFYGSAVAPNEFVGLANRYNLSTAGNGDNVILSGGTGSTDNTSVWLIAWDPNTVTGIFPQGSQAGLEHTNKGIQTVDDQGGTAGALMDAYREHFTWDAGIALCDWRYVVRIANVDVSELEETSSSPDLIRYMADAEMRLPNSLGRRAFYMNRTVARNLRRQVTAAVGNGGGLTFENFAGKRIMMFGTTPVRIVDALVNTEDVVA